MASETQHLLEHIQDLQARLDEAEETLRAVRSGEVDAVVASGPDGDHVYTLRGADEAYRVMVENMAEGALTVTPAGLILFSNEQFASISGLPLEQVIGASIQDFIAAADAPMLAALLAGSAGTKAEIRLKHVPDALVPVHIAANKLLLDGTECVCLIITDLSEQKRSEEMVAAERLARSILDQTAGAILVLDPDGKIIRASRAAEHLANGPVLLRQFDDVFLLRNNSGRKDYRLEEILSTAQRQGSIAGVEATARRPDGQTLDVMVSASLLTGANSECLGCIVLLSDVSALKRAEEALRENEARLRNLGDNLPEGAIYRYCQDVHGKPHFEFVSAGIERLTGVPAAEIMRDASAVDRTILPQDFGRVRAAVALSRQNLTRFEMEIRHQHRSTGEERWSLLRSMPSRRHDGTTVWDGIQLDITDRKHAEERLQQKQKLESIGLLAGGIAHDFNNILTVIMGSTSLALDQCPDCGFSRTILAATERAAYLTRQLLDYAGKGRLAVEVVSLTDLISRSTELLRASVSKKVVLDFDLAQDLPRLEADPSQMEQILMNLVINAGEAIPPGTDGLIRIATWSCEVTPEMAARDSSALTVGAGRFVCLEVQDNGSGMDDATVSRIFDPFFTTKFTGRGLGLAAVDGIVRSNQGFIKVRSQPGSGTTFQVFLPASRQTRPAQQVPREASPTAHGLATILVVDDEQALRELAGITLKRCGYTVLEARNGKDALHLLTNATSLPDVVLLDLAMPVMGGDELLPILRARFAGLPVIFSSGYSEDETRKVLPSASVVGFLQKPYSSKALAEKVQQILAARNT